MPYIRIDPEMYMEHVGVEVFHAYRDGTNEPWDYWFTTDPETADESHAHGSHGWFDIRMLAGRWSETPTVAQWDEFWKPRFAIEQDAIIALIKQGIEEKKIGNTHT